MIGWSFQGYAKITAQAGAGTNYDVEVDLTFAQCGSVARPDFGDVRFTALDGSTLLNYYLVSYIASTSAVFVVQVTDDLSTINGLIVFYAGNSSVTTTSTKATYTKFIDGQTDESSSFVNRQILNQAGTLTYDAGNKRYGASYGGTYMGEMFEIQSLSGNSWEIKVDYQFPASDFGFGISARYSGSGLYVLSEGPQAYVNGSLSIVKVTSPPTNGNTQLASVGQSGQSANTWYTLKARIYGNNLYIINAQGNTVSYTDSSSPFTTGTYGPFMYQQAANKVFWKNFIVRPYVNPEPAVYEIGVGNGLAAPAAGATVGAPTLVDPANGRTIP